MNYTIKCSRFKNANQHKHLTDVRKVLMTQFSSSFLYKTKSLNNQRKTLTVKAFEILVRITGVEPARDSYC